MATQTRSKKKKKVDSRGIVHIKATFNNTNITINRTAIAGLAGKVKDEELEQA